MYIPIFIWPFQHPLFHSPCSGEVRHLLMHDRCSESHHLMQHALDLPVYPQCFSFLSVNSLNGKFREEGCSSQERATPGQVQSQQFEPQQTSSDTCQHNSYRALTAAAGSPPSCLPIHEHDTHSLRSFSLDCF